MPIDIQERILDKLDILDEKVDKICLWKESMSTEWKNHMEEQDAKSKGKERKTYYLIALMGVGFTLFEMIKEAVR